MNEHERRRLGDQFAAELRAIRAELYELKDRHSIKKNGHTWAQYLSKWITPQNIVSAVLVVFMLGGRWQRMENGVDAAVEAAKRASASQEQMLAEIARLNRTVEAQQALINKQRDLYATKEDLSTAVTSGIKSSVSMLVTRREWRELVDMQQQNARRLVRIESSVVTK